MAIPHDNVLDKFNVLIETAKRDRDAAELSVENAERRLARWTAAFEERVKDLGFCPHCERLIDSCVGHQILVRHDPSAAIDLTTSEIETLRELRRQIGVDLFNQKNAR